MKKLVPLLLLALAAFGLASCDTELKTITMVWLPNESSNDMKGNRDAIGELITQATGKEVDHKLTTDYAIAVEALASDNGHMAWYGPQSFVEANAKNSAIQPLVVPTGASGTLADAVYYAWLIVLPENESQFLTDGKWNTEALPGKSFSWVSTSSTSGFKVPSSGIVGYFSKKPEWANLKPEDLLEGGQGKFFREVMFGSSHQGSAVNVLSGNAEVGAVCDTCVSSYVELISGEDNRPGAVYRVKQDAEAPFTPYAGKTVRVIQSVPVLNSPFVVNTKILPKAEIDKLLALMLSDATANNPRLFAPKGATPRPMFTKTKGERFAAVTNEWFNPIRELAQ